MGRLQRLVLPIQPFVANRTFFRAAVRFHDRLFTPAVVALCWAGYAAGGMPSMPGPSRPLFSRPLRSFKIVFFRLPPGTPAYTLGSGMGCEYPCEGTRWSVRGSPPPPAPPVRRSGETALIYAAHNDDRATVAALLGARADVNTKGIHGCAVCRRRCPARGRRWPTVTPMAAVPAPSGRWTALHYAAYNGFISAGVELLVGGADQTITNDRG